jgi:hypothetical protein
MVHSTCQFKNTTSLSAAPSTQEQSGQTHLRHSPPATPTVSTMLGLTHHPEIQRKDKRTAEPSKHSKRSKVPHSYCQKSPEQTSPDQKPQGCSEPEPNPYISPQETQVSAASIMPTVSAQSCHGHGHHHLSFNFYTFITQPTPLPSLLANSSSLYSRHLTLPCPLY